MVVCVLVRLRFKHFAVYARANPWVRGAPANRTDVVLVLGDRAAVRLVTGGRRVEAHLGGTGPEGGFGVNFEVG